MLKKKSSRKTLKRIIITCYNKYSESCKLLQQALKELVPTRRVLRVDKRSTSFVERASDFYIAWGNCLSTRWLNDQQEQAKAIAANKLKTFQAFMEHDVAHPDWTTDKELAIEWINEKFPVVARCVLTGHSGDGIYLVDSVENLPDAPLYVKYKKKKHEYRVHVFNGEVLDVVQKKRKAGFEGRNNQIRNHQNGWVFCREGIQEPDDLRSVAIHACAAVGVKFGAVDVIWNQRENKCYALEINTAPGIEGSTVQKYAERFVEELNENQAM